jgi:adenylate kinase
MKRSAEIADKHMKLAPTVALIGAPGSGKGTQADLLAKSFGWRHVASGDLFREHLKNATPLGERARSFINRGQLAPDDITDAMIEECLARFAREEGIILDGFPRTLAQAAALEEMLRKLSRSLTGVVCIHVPDEVLIDRLAGRVVCSVCESPYHLKFSPPARPNVCDQCGGRLYQRDDDKPETVRARLATFHKQTEPLIDRYRTAGLLMLVDGQGDIETITEAIIEALEKTRTFVRS